MYLNTNNLRTIKTTTVLLLDLYLLIFYLEDFKMKIMVRLNCGIMRFHLFGIVTVNTVLKRNDLLDNDFA